MNPSSAAFQHESAQVWIGTADKKDMTANKFRRPALLELIHEFELHHQTCTQVLGFDPYRARVWEHEDERKDRETLAVWEEGCAAASAASQLRGVVERIDNKEKVLWDL